MVEFVETDKRYSHEVSTNTFEMWSYVWQYFPAREPMTDWVPTTCMRCAVGCGHLQQGVDVGYGVDVVRGDAAHPSTRDWPASAASGRARTPTESGSHSP